MDKIPIIREDDKELLGFVVKDGASWDAQTIFGYSMGRSDDEQSARRTVRENGLAFLGGVWQYFDKDDREWHACVLKEATERQVTIMRTTPLGYQDPDDYKIVTIVSPTETDLVKS
jgi:hypothetical protein